MGGQGLHSPVQPCFLLFVSVFNLNEMVVKDKTIAKREESRREKRDVTRSPPDNGSTFVDSIYLCRFNALKY